MIIAIASGKGGTGKTTIATNLAASLNEKVQLLDCDVEEPNAQIFIKAQIEKREPVYRIVPQVDTKKCDLCGACGKICQFSAINAIGKAILTFPEMCHGCKGCIMVCPQDAISEGSVEIGEMEWGIAGNIEFIHGRLKVGEAMSPPLIKKVKQEIHSDGIAIVDAPPGTSCPMIATITDSDFVLLVTEPTPFGLNDLELAVEAVRAVKKPCGIVINRSDVGDDRIKIYAEKEGIPIFLEIPEIRKIAEAYSRGEMIINAIPEMKKDFQRLYDDIAQIVQGVQK